jgi:hypothetical protein
MFASGAIACTAITSIASSRYQPLPPHSSTLFQLAGRFWVNCPGLRSAVPWLRV